MANPITKKELIDIARTQFAQLWEFIHSITEEEQIASFLFEDRDKNVRDVLVHLYEWHQLFFNWYQEGTVEGGLPDVPKRGYSWRQLKELNATIWEKHQDVTLNEAKALLQESHKKIMQLLNSHTEEEIFEKKRYKWTKTSNLNSYFHANTGSHYKWAIKKLTKHVKTYRKAQKDENKKRAV